MRGRRRPVLGLALAVSLLAGCDLGPSGPGTLTGRASAEGLGGVLLEVQGTGIRGFAGRGGTQVYAAPVADRSGVHRVLLIDPAGGEIGFDVEVEDRGMEGPVVTVVQATDTANASMPRSDVAVRIER
jgi:hypothetical protein